MFIWIKLNRLLVTIALISQLLKDRRCLSISQRASHRANCIFIEIYFWLQLLDSLKCNWLKCHICRQLAKDLLRRPNEINLVSSNHLTPDMKFFELRISRLGWLGRYRDYWLYFFLSGLQLLQLFTWFLVYYRHLSAH